VLLAAALGRFLVAAAALKDKCAFALFFMSRFPTDPGPRRPCPVMTSAALMLAAATRLQAIHPRSIPLYATPARSSTMPS
jgi:hypothetical protein